LSALIRSSTEATTSTARIAWFDGLDLTKGERDQIGRTNAERVFGLPTDSLQYVHEAANGDGEDS
jgi:hypothetical protein